MNIHVEVKRGLQVGDFFSLEGTGDRLYQLIEVKEHMTPLMVVNVRTGQVVGRSTSPALAVQDVGFKMHDVSVYGNMTSFSRD